MMLNKQKIRIVNQHQQIIRNQTQKTRGTVKRGIRQARGGEN